MLWKIEIEQRSGTANPGERCQRFAAEKRSRRPAAVARR
jgi:hypothetical protein